MSLDSVVGLEQTLSEPDATGVGGAGIAMRSATLPEPMQGVPRCSNGERTRSAGSWQDQAMAPRPDERDCGSTTAHGVWRCNVSVYTPVSPGERERLRYLTILFLHEKHFSAAHGLALDDAMRLHVAVQACTLILNLGMDYYRGWSEIIVYPAEFVPRHQYTDEMGIVHQGDQSYAGEAWLHGPVILSWADIAQAEYPDGVNVVIHEFAHKLDMLNGGANGYPPLHKGMSRPAWVQVFSAAYEDFCTRVDGTKRRSSTPTRRKARPSSLLC